MAKNCTNCGDCKHLCGENMRADSFDITGDLASKIDKNGYLKVMGTVTSVGVFSYTRPDGTVVREFRPPEEVFKADSIETLKNAPIAAGDNHQKTMMGLQEPNDAANLTYEGVIGSDIVKNAAGDGLDAPVIVYHPQAIEDIATKKRLHLSAGYTLRELEPTSGVYKGQPYDAIQRGITYGHVSIVERGRAGERCQIRADSAQNQESKQEKTMAKMKIPALQVKSGESIIFRADSLEVEETPEITALLSHRTQLSVEVKKALTRADTAEGELSVLKKDNEALKKETKGSISPEKYRADMDESLGLMAKLKELGIDVMKEDKPDLSPKALKMAIIKTIYPKEEMRADASDGEITGLMKGIDNDWKHRVSMVKTNEGRKYFSENGAAGNDLALNDQGYPETMKTA